MSVLYRTVRAILRAFIKIFYRVKYIGKENYCEEGPLILASNHISAPDPFFIGAPYKRQVFYLAKAELFKNKLLGRIMRSVGCIPVNRGAHNKDAIETCVNTIKAGCCIGLFPQGTRYKGQEPDVSQTKSGIGMFAVNTGANVQPVYIKTEGNRARIFHRVTVIVGKVMTKEEYDHPELIGFERYKAVTAEIFNRILETGKSV